MASKHVNPTRMEMKRIKARLKTARRGHRLLKDKRDELMRQFMEIVHDNRVLRERVEKGLSEAMAALSTASAVMSPEMLEQALLYPKQSVELGVSYKNVMRVHVPVYEFKTKNNDPSEIYPYGFAMTSGELDDALSASPACLRICLSLRALKRRCSFLHRRLKRHGAASMLWSTS